MAFGKAIGRGTQLEAGRGFDAFGPRAAIPRSQALVLVELATDNPDVRVVPPNSPRACVELMAAVLAGGSEPMAYATKWE